MDNLYEAYLDVYEKYQGLYQSPQPTYNRLKNPLAMMSPGRRAMEKSDELQRTQPGSKREKSQTRRAIQIQRHFQSARNVPEEVESWVNALIEEGYDLSEYTWEDMTEMYFNEGRTTSLRALGRESQKRRSAQARGGRESRNEINRRLMLGPHSPSAFNYERTPDGEWKRLGRKDGRTDQEVRTDTGREELKRKKKVPRKRDPKTGEMKDMFEQVLEYLVTEGYADTNKNAIAIAANMSEDWRAEIIGEANRGEAHSKTSNWDKVYDRTQRDNPGASHQIAHRERRPSGKWETGNQTTKRLSKQRVQAHKATRGVRKIKGGKGVQMQFGRAF